MRSLALSANRPRPSLRPNLLGRRILIVEDDVLQAEALRQGLTSLGARVLGPFSGTAAALRLLESGQAVDGATLDVSLGAERAFAVADALAARGVPFIFVTGMDDWAVPDVYRAAPRFGKPVDLDRLAVALSA